jgi:hypothetical protein
MTNELFNIAEYTKQIAVLKEEKWSDYATLYPIQPVYERCVDRIKRSIDIGLERTANVDISDMDVNKNKRLSDWDVEFEAFLVDMLEKIEKMLEAGNPSIQVFVMPNRRAYPNGSNTRSIDISWGPR